MLVWLSHYLCLDVLREITFLIESHLGLRPDMRPMEILEGQGPQLIEMLSQLAESLKHSLAH
jgi:hypothetical protein